MTNFVGIFNKKLLEFLDNLEDSFPKERDIGILKTGIEIAVKTRPEYVIQVYKAFVEPYRKQIDNEDEDFFMNENLTHIVKVSEDSNTAMEKINHIKKILASKKVSKESKKNIWLYLKLLNRIMDKCEI